MSFKRAVDPLKASTLTQINFVHGMCGVLWPTLLGHPEWPLRFAHQMRTKEPWGYLMVEHMNLRDRISSFGH